MNPLAQLSPRETQLAERLAWGASVKEAAVPQMTQEQG